MSAVPDAQEQLVELLEAAFTDDTEVRFAPPQERPKKNERVYVIDEADYIRAGAEQWREEAFSVRIVVEVFKSGDHAKATSDRRWALVDAVDAALLSDDFSGYRTEGGPLTADSVLFAYDKGWIARSVISIALTTRS